MIADDPQESFLAVRSAARFRRRTQSLSQNADRSVALDGPRHRGLVARICPARPPSFALPSDAMTALLLLVALAAGSHGLLHVGRASRRAGRRPCGGSSSVRRSRIIVAGVLVTTLWFVPVLAAGARRARPAHNSASSASCACMSTKRARSRHRGRTHDPAPSADPRSCARACRAAVAADPWRAGATTACGLVFVVSSTARHRSRLHAQLRTAVPGASSISRRQLAARIARHRARDRRRARDAGRPQHGRPGRARLFRRSATPRVARLVPSARRTMAAVFAWLFRTLPCADAPGNAWLTR